jgi:outer membrane protein assembly factor BamB/SAM-dependent methyltransferase
MFSHVGNRCYRAILGIVLIVTTLVLSGCGNRKAVKETPTAEAILAASGVRGGLVVHLGCGNGSLTAELRDNDRYVVHGLDTNAANIDIARQAVKTNGLYGPVSISLLTGHRLPYADNLVKLLVDQSRDSQIASNEIARVLSPGGVAIVKGPINDSHSALVRSQDLPGLNGWTKLTKPWSKESDEWTHWLHGPDGNAVSHDQVAGPPRRMQWAAGPPWSRHHHLLPSVSAMVSAGGRLFYIVDMAPAGMTGRSPDQWELVARDAFSGIDLWHRTIPDWGWRAWSHHSGGRFNQPNQIPKRLVAIGDIVYVTLGFNSPLTALDAATGEIIRTYDGTEYTDEILYQDGTLVLSLNHAAQRAAELTRDPKTGKKVPKTTDADPPVEKSIVSIEAATGRVLWKTSDRFVGNSTKTGDLERITHLLLSVKGSRVYLLDRNQVIALDLNTGKRLWEAPRPKSERHTSRYHHLTSDMCTLVASDDAILLCQLEPDKVIGWRLTTARVRAYSPETGATLWTHSCGNWGHFNVPDVFVTGGLVWVHHSAEMAMIGLDPTTGSEKRRISTERAATNGKGHHHRCYRNKATDRYLMTSFRGFEFIDWNSNVTDMNHWVRGTCKLGGMPCNGLIYATPHPCRCYTTAMLNGMMALAPAAPTEPTATESRHDSSRLVIGPAYGTVTDYESSAGGNHDWPTYRHDPGRSGSTSEDVATGLELRWTRKLTGRLSAPVVAGGKVLVTSVNTHGVYALDSDTGTPGWNYTANGQVDTPPTLYNGLALFGCRDGWVYALRADTGKLVWQFLAAHEERLVGAYGRLESAWPVNGSVLVQNDRAYVVAGRSSFLDGGIRAWCLNPVTGEVLDSQLIVDEENRPVDSGLNPRTDYGALTDLLLGDGKDIYMRQRRLFGQNRNNSNWGDRLNATAGMLDDVWFNRAYWILDGTMHGKSLIHDDTTTFAVRGYSWIGDSLITAGKARYKLSAAERPPPPDKKGKAARWQASAEDKWIRPISIRVRAMALAGKTLLCAGTPDILDPEDTWAAYEGRRGGILLVISATDGKTRAEFKFDGGPILDGIAVADERVYITTNDGRVLCFAGTSKSAMN